MLIQKRILIDGNEGDGVAVADRDKKTCNIEKLWTIRGLHKWNKQYTSKKCKRSWWKDGNVHFVGISW